MGRPGLDPLEEDTPKASWRRKTLSFWGGIRFVAKCRYSGLDAGVLRDHHKECEEKHERGWARMLEISAETARTGQGYEKLEPALAALATYSYVPSAQIHEALMTGWEQAAGEAIEDRILSIEEESHLSGFIKHFQLSREELDRNKAWNRIVMAACLRDILEGKTPSRITVSGDLPFNFQRAESVRIDSGYLGITTKHVYFTGARKGFRVPYRKIMAFTPFKDGFGIVRDAASAKPQAFQTEDGWFTYNLVRNLASRSSD